MAEIDHKPIWITAPEHAHAGSPKPKGECGCHACREEKVEAGHWVMPMMVLCPTCGNKRCPHATNHRHYCTGSNEPGQKGSIYE